MKKAKLRTRIALGFAFILLILLSVGGIVSSVAEDVSHTSGRLSEIELPEMAMTASLNTAFLELNLAVRGFSLTNDLSLSSEIDALKEKTSKELGRLESLAQTHPKEVPKLIAVLPEIRSSLNRYYQQIRKTFSLAEEQGKAWTEMDVAGAKLSQIGPETMIHFEEALKVGLQSYLGAEGQLALIEELDMARQLMDEISAIRILSNKALATGQLEMIQQCWDKFARIREIGQKLRVDLEKTGDATGLKEVAAFLAAALDYEKDLGAMHKSRLQRNEVNRERGQTATELASLLLRHSEGVAENAVAESVGMNQMVQNMIANLQYLVIGGVLLGILISYFIVIGITRPINSVTGSLTDGSEQIALAASESANSAQNVADVTTHISASLQETSASIDQVTSMVQKNADHAREANVLMQSTSSTVDLANDAMRAMQTSMADINSNSNEIAKIIKVIEEIAFQTNLLALNAAVEAARAGEHGQGFAVVADEVRNLAQRAASSARDIGKLIETAGKNVTDGLNRVNHVAERLGEVTNSARKVASLIEEIATASIEQAHGIEQINKAIADMEKGTQEVAASAEESAASSEEMASQSEAMREVVVQLIRLVDGAGEALGHLAESRSRKPAARIGMQSKKPLLGKAGMKKPAAAAKAKRPGVQALEHKVAHDDILPLGDDEF